MMNLSICEILTFLDENHIGYEYVGDSDLIIEGFCSLNHPKAHSIFWVKKAKD